MLDELIIPFFVIASNWILPKIWFSKKDVVSLSVSTSEIHGLCFTKASFVNSHRLKKGPCPSCLFSFWVRVMKALSRSVGLLQRTDCRLGGDDWGLYLASEVYRLVFIQVQMMRWKLIWTRQGPLQWGRGIHELKTWIRKKADMVELHKKDFDLEL